TRGCGSPVVEVAEKFTRSAFSRIRDIPDPRRPGALRLHPYGEGM
ncbi:unnamed protein product, partial [marine sediment metagenome]